MRDGACAPLRGALVNGIARHESFSRARPALAPMIVETPQLIRCGITMEVRILEREPRASHWNAPALAATHWVKVRGGRPVTARTVGSTFDSSSAPPT